jgi:hypothetical protein
LNPEAPDVLASLSGFEAARGAAIFTALSKSWIVDPLVRGLKLAQNNALLGGAVLPLVKQFVFPQFCAGETLEDCKHLAAKLNVCGVKVMVDHSTEEGESPDDWAENLRNKINLLRRCRDVLGDRVTFVPLKVRVDPSPFSVFPLFGNVVSCAARRGARPTRACLQVRSHLVYGRPDEKVSALIQIQPQPSTFSAHPQVTALASPAVLEEMTDLIQADPDVGRSALRLRMGVESLMLLDTAIENLSELCRVAMEVQLPLLLDAEQSHRQPAIDYISSELMQTFNVIGNSPVVYNTYQM